MTAYSATNPFIAKLKSRLLLSKPGSTKRTFKLVLDISKSNLSFEPGDCIGALPQNDPQIVSAIIKLLKASPTLSIIDPKTKTKTTLENFLLLNANISKLTPSLVNKIINRDLDSKKIREIISNNQLIDLLSKYSNNFLAAQDVCDHLLPLLPRLYSISSSFAVHPDELHLLVSHVTFRIGDSLRNGVCSHYLCFLADEGSPIPIYLNPSSEFRMVKDPQSPIIMIGSGCGIAPYIAFIEERALLNSCNQNWLFLGERNQKTDYYYEEFFKGLEKQGFLKISPAFSRDQEKKIYAQHKLYENKKEIWQWIQKGAYIYVCGDAKTLGKDIEAALLKIFVTEGNLSEDQALEFIRELRSTKRYLRDVY